MASKGNTWENDYLKLLFNATAVANIADNAASAPLTQLFVGLHTGDPGEAGSQTTNETAYTNYARIGVNRNSGGWTVTNNQVVNAGAITFPTCGVTGASITHLTIGTVVSGAGKILYSGAVGPTTNLGFFTSTAADVITIPNLTQVSAFLAVDDRVSFYPTPAATLPSGMTEGTVYFVKTVSTNDITIALTSGGATIDLTTVGAGVIYKHSVLVVNNLITPNFAAGQLLVQED